MSFFFDGDVEVHEDVVGDGGQKHREALEPKDLGVDQDDDEHDDGEAVDEAVTCDRIPVKNIRLL